MAAPRPVKAILWIGGAMALTMALYVAVRIFTDFTPFRIDHIEVRGNVRTPYDTVVKSLGLAPGQNLFSERIAELVERAGSLPWVKSARIMRRIPDAVVVEVEEWEPVCLIRLDRLYYLTKEAHVINAPLSLGLDYPIVTGFTWARIEKQGFDRDRLIMALDLMVKGGFGDKVSELFYDPALGITMYGEGTGKPWGVFFGFGDLEERLSRFARLKKSLEKKGRYAVSADLSFEDRIVARLAPLNPPGERGDKR